MTPQRLCRRIFDTFMQTVAKMYIGLLLLAGLVVNVAFGGEFNKSDCGSVTIQCVCGIGDGRRIISLDLKMYSIEDAETGKNKCSGFSDPYQACANHSCILASNSTTSLEKAKKGKKTNGNEANGSAVSGSSGQERGSLMSAFYPLEFTVPRGGFPEGHRFARQSEPCHVTPLKNAEIKCWKWPNWINCDINCIHGYALQGSKDSSKNININCRLTENTWKPHGFQDCQPYVNCKAHLVKPGDLRCKEPINAPAYCEISCLDYDQYEATSLQKYECLDETFARTLPHCAVLSGNVQLVRKPK